MQRWNEKEKKNFDDYNSDGHCVSVCLDHMHGSPLEIASQFFFSGFINVENDANNNNDLQWDHH